VTLWIDESTFMDQDYIDGSSAMYIEDTIGEITWSVTAGEGTVYPTIGSSTTLTAGAADADNTITIQASVEDSCLGDDAPVAKEKNLDAKAPTGIQVIDHETLNADLGANGNAKIGAKTKFSQQLKPVTVNFKGLALRYSRPQKTVNWPDMTADTRAAVPVTGFSVSDRTVGALVIHNNTSTTLTEGLHPKGRINDGVAYKDFSWERTEINEYKKDDGTWKEFSTLKQKRDFRGAQLDCRLGIEDDWGTRQGPFQ